MTIAQPYSIVEANELMDVLDDHRDFLQSSFFVKKGWEYWPQSLLRQMDLLRRYRRSRSDELHLLADTAAFNLLWGASWLARHSDEEGMNDQNVVAQSVRYALDSYYQSLRWTGAHLQEVVGPEQMPNELVAYVESVADGGVHDDVAHHILHLIDRVYAMDRKIQTLPFDQMDTEHGRYLLSSTQYWYGYAAQAARAYCDDQTKPFQTTVTWIGHSLPILEAISAAMILPVNWETTKSLLPVVGAHQRIDLVDVPAVPVYAVGTLDWFDQMQVVGWRNPPTSGRIRAICTRTNPVVLLGPAFARSALRNFERGHFTPGLLHEMLHACPIDASNEQRRDSEAEWQEKAWYEGAHHGWAQALCRAAYDPISGVRGGWDRSRVLQSWVGAVEGLADAIEQYPLDVSQRIALSPRFGRLQQVARWVYACDDEASVQRVITELGPIMRQAWDQRHQAGIRTRMRSEMCRAVMQARATKV